MGLSRLVILLLIAATHLLFYFYFFLKRKRYIMTLCQVFQLHVSLVRVHWRHLSISVRVLLASPEANAPSLTQK